MTAESIKKKADVYNGTTRNAIVIWIRPLIFPDCSTHFGRGSVSRIQESFISHDALSRCLDQSGYS